VTLIPLFTIGSEQAKPAAVLGKLKRTKTLLLIIRLEVHDLVPPPS
jgi:hypothetical protein